MIRKLSATLLLALGLSASTAAQNVRVSPNPVLYPNLKSAFDAVNSGAHTGSVLIEVLGDTVETQTAVLQASGVGAASYTQLTLNPIGARRITGDPGSGQPLLDLAGADYVTLNGLNVAGHSLEISNSNASAAAGTSTIRLRGDIRQGAIRNLTILSRATVSLGTPGGAVVISDTSGDGVDSIEIDHNVIGTRVLEDGLTQGFYCAGQNTSLSGGNSVLLLAQNQFINVFSNVSNSAALQIGTGCFGMTITGNYIYQTGVRRFGAPIVAPTHFGIRLLTVNAVGGTGTTSVRENIIGGSGPNGLDDTRIFDGNGKFVGIWIGEDESQLLELRDNEIGRIQRRNTSASGTGLSAPFAGILVASGLVSSYSDHVGPFLFESDNAATSDVLGMALLGGGELLTSLVEVQGLTVRSPAGVADLRLIGVQCRSGAGVLGNLRVWAGKIGRTEQDSLIAEANSPSGGQIVGIHSECALTVIESTDVAGLSGNSFGGPNGLPAIQGIYAKPDALSGSYARVIENRVSRLRSTRADATPLVQGLYVETNQVSALNTVSQNAVYRLQAVAPMARLEGMQLKASGSLEASSNSVYLGRRADASPIETGMSIRGVRLGGTGQIAFRQNSVLLAGERVDGGQMTTAIEIAAPIGALMQNNVLVNARSNGSGNGKHIAVRFVDGYSNQHDYNLYHASGIGGVLVRNSNGSTDQDYTNLASWQTAVGGGTHNLSGPPGYTLTDVLHLRSDSIARNIGVAPVNSTFENTLDIDGQPRPGSDGLYDLGADEAVPGSVPGSLSVSRSLSQLGTTMVDEPSNGQSVTIGNDAPNGAQSITISFDVAPSSQVRIGASTCASNQVLAPGDTCVLGLSAQSAQPGPVQGSLVVYTAEGESAYVTLVGQINAPQLRARGQNTVFTRVGSTAPALLTLTNEGAPAWWRIEQLNIFAPPFSLADAASCSPLPRQLSAGQSCAMELSFAPLSSGPVSLLANIQGRAGYFTGLPLNIAATLEGFGTSNTLGLLPAVVDFGIVLVGEQGVPQSTRLGNGDSVARTISVQSPIQAPFSVLAGSTCQATPGVLVSAHESCLQQFGFSPVGEGFFEQLVTIQTSDGDTQTLTLRGTGTTQVLLHADGFE